MNKSMKNSIKKSFFNAVLSENQALEILKIFEIAETPSKEQVYQPKPDIPFFEILRPEAFDHENLNHKTG